MIAKLNPFYTVVNLQIASDEKRLCYNPIGFNFSFNL
jgi:hypothetical protein